MGYSRLFMFYFNENVEAQDNGKWEMENEG